MKKLVKKLTMQDGTTYIVTDEIGKFYICGSTQFKKSNPKIARIEEICEQDGENNAVQGEMPFDTQSATTAFFADFTPFDGLK